VTLCRHFGVCGGCQWQDVPYPEQLRRKRTALEQRLAVALGPAAPSIAPVIGMPVADDGLPWHFRHKASFVFGPADARGRGLVMGHFARASKSIVPVEECPVHADRANRLAFELRDQLARARISAAGPRLEGVLRHLLVRTTHDEREAIVMLVVTRNDASLKRPLRLFLASPEPPDGLFVNVHYRPGPFMLGDETVRISGHRQVRENRLETSFLVSPTAFFQTNPDAAAAMVEVVLREGLAGSGARALNVLDLYAGSGLFALPLAARGCRVTAVEENASAVGDAQANQRLNRIPENRVSVVCARVEDFLGRVSKSPDLAVLDPPRQGCAPGVLDELFGRLAPQRVIYISCNAETLAQELPVALDAGYRVTLAQPIDMFPHTEHVETVVVMERG
jgi:23S rRNA (uracil1939-C5)-methyltransferase